jgi:SHS2 domain-containing protein
MFVEIPHTADKAIYVESTTLEGLFYDSALGLMAISGISPLKSKKIYHDNYEVSSVDSETLLVDFLNFLIYKLDLGFYLINSEIRIDSIHLFSKNYFGKFKNREIYIKSATFHNLKIVKYNHLYRTKIVFDI